MGPLLFTIVFDSLLRRLQLLFPAFADDFEFVNELEHHSLAVAQDDLATVNDWSNTYLMLFSIQKSLVLHCDAHNLNRIYSLQWKIVTPRETYA